LRAIDGYDGQPNTGAALKLAPYVFVRPGELRAAEWSEIVLDGDEPLWRIPARGAADDDATLGRFSRRFTEKREPIVRVESLCK
jgi:integrase